MDKEEKSKAESYLLGCKWLERIKNRKDDKSYQEKNVSHWLLNAHTEFPFFLDRPLFLAGRNENALRCLKRWRCALFPLHTDRTSFASFLTADCVRRHWLSRPSSKRIQWSTWASFWVIRYLSDKRYLYNFIKNHMHNFKSMHIAYRKTSGAEVQEQVSCIS